MVVEPVGDGVDSLLVEDVTLQVAVAVAAVATNVRRRWDGRRRFDDFFVVASSRQVVRRYS
jgi:Mg/Co/Ni transporter MgtE